MIKIENKILYYIQDEIKKPTLFRNYESINPNYIPDDLPERHENIKFMVSEYKHLLNNKNFSLNYLILGDAGSGKTVIAKAFGHGFKTIVAEKFPNFFVEYFNCLEFRSKSKIVRRLLAIVNPGSSGRGYGDEEAWTYIFRQLQIKQSFLFWILDEIQFLNKKDLLDLLNLAEVFGLHNVKISIILICRNKDWINYETEKILSRINQTINLKKYNFSECVNILKYRSELSIKEGVISKDILLEIGRMISNSGNLRQGIELLRQAVVLTEKEGLNKVNIQILKKAEKKARYSRNRHLLDQLKIHEILVLSAIIKKIIKKTWCYVDDCFPLYEKICKSCKIQPHTKMSFRKYIRILAQAEMLKTKTIKIEDENRGRCLKIELPVNKYDFKDINNEFDRFISSLAKYNKDTDSNINNKEIKKIEYTEDKISTTYKKAKKIIKEGFDEVVKQITKPIMKKEKKIQKDEPKPQKMIYNDLNKKIKEVNAKKCEDNIKRKSLKISDEEKVIKNQIKNIEQKEKKNPIYIDSKKPYHVPLELNKKERLRQNLKKKVKNIIEKIFQNNIFDQKLSECGQDKHILKYKNLLYKLTLFCLESTFEKLKNKYRYTTTIVAVIHLVNKELVKKLNIPFRISAKDLAEMLLIDQTDVLKVYSTLVDMKIYNNFSIEPMIIPN